MSVGPRADACRGLCPIGGEGSLDGWGAGASVEAPYQRVPERWSRRTPRRCNPTGFFRGAASLAVAVAVAITAVTMFGTGCVTIYHPLSGLQTPTLVDPALPNFEGLRLVVRCVPGSFLEEQDADRLCRIVERAFANQGAVVETLASVNPAEDRRRQEADAPPESAVRPPTETLTLELRARELDRQRSLWRWFFCIFTLTLYPARSEYSFSQEAIVRSEDGALLARAELDGRIVRYYGLGYWASNGLANLLLRDDDEDISNATFKLAFSGDMFGQLSQMVYNARWRQRALDARPTTGAKSGAATGAKTGASDGAGPSAAAGGR